jgi:hypothetical protein
MPGDPAVPLNSCYVIHAPTIQDAQALTVILRSTLVAAWLRAVAEPARGGYQRHLGWTMGMLPLPADWSTARDRLACFAVADGNVAHDPTCREEAVVASYGIDARELRPLLEWNLS